MSVLEWLALGLLAWLLLGLVLIKLAHRAGYTWGFYPGEGVLCRLCVVLQAPGLLLDVAIMDLRVAMRVMWTGLRSPDDRPLVWDTARMLWLVFCKPSLSPDDAFELIDAGKPTR